MKSYSWLLGDVVKFPLLENLWNVGIGLLFQRDYVGGPFLEVRTQLNGHLKFCRSHDIWSANS